jgi:hypothetical protein
MAFTPEDGLRNTEKYPATPASEDEAREQFQGLLDQLKAAVNNLMAALENADTEVSGAGNIGSAPIANLEYMGTSPATVREQIIALNAKIIDAITNGLSVSQIIGDKGIKPNMLDDNAVTAGKIAVNAVTADNIAAASVGDTKLGMIRTIKLDTGDTLVYDTTNNKLKLKVSGCTEVQLCPVFFSTSATPTAGTYPAGTIYFQFVE